MTRMVPLLGSSLDALIGELQVQVTALLSAGVTLDLGGIDAQIELATSLLSALQAALTLGVRAPTVTFQLDAVLDLQARLRALTALRSQLNVGLHAYAFHGRARDFGPELAGAITGTPGVAPSDIAAGVALMGNAPGALAVLGSLFSI
jgi:hypothetical protein